MGGGRLDFLEGVTSKKHHTEYHFSVPQKETNGAQPLLLHGVTYQVKFPFMKKTNFHTLKQGCSFPPHGGGGGREKRFTPTPSPMGGTIVFWRGSAERKAGFFEGAGAARFLACERRRAGGRGAAISLRAKKETIGGAT